MQSSKHEWSMSMMSNALRFHLRRYGVLEVAFRHPKLFSRFYLEAGQFQRRVNGDAAPASSCKLPLVEVVDGA